jgi:hypothetical protein
MRLERRMLLACKVGKWTGRGGADRLLAWEVGGGRYEVGEESGLGGLRRDSPVSKLDVIQWNKR